MAALNRALIGDLAPSDQEADAVSALPIDSPANRSVCFRIDNRHGGSMTCAAGASVKCNESVPVLKCQLTGGAARSKDESKQPSGGFMRLATSALISALVMTLGMAGHAAHAADLPQRSDYRAPVMAPAPVPSWTGCYVGGNVGYGWGRAEVETAVGGISWTNGGITGGGQIGCDYQFAGTGFVVGIRDMFNWTGLESSGTFAGGPLAGSTASSETTWVNTLTGRIGYAVIPTGLLYVQGGGAWSRMNADITNGAGAKIGQFANNKGGYDVGVGWEYKFAPNWSGFVEYNYMNFGSSSGTTTTGVNVEVKKDSQNIVFGINWRM